MAEDTIKDEEYAPITKGLRLYADTMLSEYSPILFHIKELCDNIDALHKALEEQNTKLHEKVLNQRKQLAEVQEAIERRNNGVLKRRWQKKMDALKKENEKLRDFTCRVREAIRRREDITLFGADYMALREDADGVPTHIGDKIDRDDGETVVVTGVSRYGAFYYSDTEQRIRYMHSSELHHHADPTVEDVLHQFLDECENAMMRGCSEVPQEVFDNYAKLLQLAEVEE